MWPLRGSWLHSLSALACCTRPLACPIRGLAPSPLPEAVGLCPGLLCRANPHAGPALASWPASPSIHPAPLQANKTQLQKTSKSPYWALTVPSQKFQGLHTAFCLSHPGLLNAPGWVSAPSLCPHRFFPLSPSPPQEPPPPGSHPDCSRSAVTVSVSPGPRWARPEPTLVL